MDKVKVGIIGVGQIGKRHVAGYAEMPDVEIVAVADLNEAEARRVATEHGIPHVFSNFRDLLAMPEIQAVDVCLHNNFHAPVSIAAMEAGKDVFCEKPMAGTYADALAMYEASRRTGRRLAIQMATVFSPETKAARRLIDAGMLGRLYYARAVSFRRRGRPYVDGYGTSNFVQKAVASGGALIDSGIYEIAQMLFLLDNPAVRTISGATYQEIDMYADRRESSKYDVEEMALGFVRLAGGITFDIEVSWAQHYTAAESSKVLGAKGGVRLEPLGYFSTVADMEMDGTFDLKRAEFRLHACDPTYEAYDSPQRHWVAILQGRVPGIDTAGLALNTALISEGIYLSQQLGREVTPEEVRERSVSTSIRI
ncbi:MAG TPA: Gfo/Idh/MocA family oxidoreductase [Roseiflexaceae bacterium]|nr:Gfo/Idh/MocA family oxidoreductase [Roseiflexaceae bacterium]